DAVMAGYGTIVKHAPSRQLPPEIAARRAEARTIRASLPETPAPRPSVPEVPAVAAPESGDDAFRKRRERLARQAERARNLNLIS
ncbi:MAG TPA: hypothetical protein VN281_14835, partial [Verrucomicrobiae bacterium]|nr:hypothetical protein [Verrucomicrobiae bacterium]